MNLEAAKDRFEKRHTPHANPAAKGEPFELKLLPSPTTDHIRVQCGCGYGWRYTFAELGIPPRQRETRRRPDAG